MDDGPGETEADRTTPRPLTRAELRALLRSVGLRSTGPRVAVLEHLQDAVGPLSHSEIAEALAHEGYDRATLYRNLSDLTEVNLLSRADRGDHIWRFELKRLSPDHAAEHPHFVCTDCGTVSCVPELALPAPTQVPAAIGRVSEVLLKGRCHDCTTDV